MKNKNLLIIILVLVLLFTSTIFTYASSDITICIVRPVGSPDWILTRGSTWDTWRSYSNAFDGYDVPSSLTWQTGGRVYYETYPLYHEPDYQTYVYSTENISDCKTTYQYVHEHDFTYGKEYPSSCHDYVRHWYCRICAYSYNEIVEAEFDAHDYVLNTLASVKSTCTEKGYNVYDCSQCGNYYREFLELDPDNHDLNGLGFCKRKGCSYSTAKEWLDNVGSNVEDSLNNVGDSVSDYLEGGQQSVRDSFETFLSALLGTIVLILFYFIFKRFI